MQNNIYAVYDTKAGYYMPTFMEATDASATRALEGAIMQEASPLSKNASDYQLFYIGTWDPFSGKISSDTPRHVMDAWVLKAQLENNKPEE